MNTLNRKILNAGKRAHTAIFHPSSVFGASYELAQYSGQAAADLIKQKLLSDQAVMIARFGSVELGCVLNYHFMKQERSSFGKSMAYMQSRIPAFWPEASSVQMMCNNAGFFPQDEVLLEKFYELMMNDIQQLDVLGSWLKEEKLLAEELKNVIKVRLPDLEPYYHQQPWTTALAGKKVLVIHPYAESIQQQYKKRKLLFTNENILPAFELKTIKAVQSIAGSKTEYKTWFEALDHMKEQVSQTDFDIALIGCGAYGFPLAAHVKRIGKKAVHIGGATQILFGIKGKRWEDHEQISTFMNEHWSRPLPSEVPTNFTKVEDGCYW